MKFSLFSDYINRIEKGIDNLLVFEDDLMIY